MPKIMQAENAVTGWDFASGNRDPTATDSLVARPRPPLMTYGTQPWPPQRSTGKSSLDTPAELLRRVAAAAAVNRSSLAPPPAESRATTTTVEEALFAKAECSAAGIGVVRSADRYSGRQREAWPQPRWSHVFPVVGGDLLRRVLRRRCRRRIPLRRCR